MAAEEVNPEPEFTNDSVCVVLDCNGLKDSDVAPVPVCDSRILRSTRQRDET